jgi:uncharacterized BrkB/YihY/UPF0761 family membrane protein
MVFQLAPYLAKSVPGVGVLGAIVGAVGAVAKNAQLLKDGKISQRDAALDTTKETAGAGLATAFSAAVVGAVGGGLAVSLGVALAAGIAGKYAFDRGAEYIEDRCKVKQSVLSDDELAAALK